MALRRDEDAAAMRRSAPSRCGCRSARRRIAATTRRRRSSPACGERTRSSTSLAPAVADFWPSVEPDLVLAPQAVGGHVDHIQVVRALDGRDCRGARPVVARLPLRGPRTRTRANRSATRMAALVGVETSRCRRRRPRPSGGPAAPMRASSASSSAGPRLSTGSSRPRAGRRASASILLTARGAGTG